MQYLLSGRGCVKASNFKFLKDFLMEKGAWDGSYY